MAAFSASSLDGACGIRDFVAPIIAYFLRLEVVGNSRNSLVNIANIGLRYRFYARWATNAPHSELDGGYR